MQSRSARYLLLALLPFTLACPLNRGAKAADAPQVNVYAYRQPYLISPLLKKFTEETGDLIERIAAEGRNSPADLRLTVDVGNLMQAKEEGFGQAVHSQTLEREKEAEQKEWTNSVYILFPNANDRGTYVNISGAVLAKNAPHEDNARKLMEFLVFDNGQEMYAEVNNEYPVKEGVPWSPLVKSWGPFKPNPISLNEITALGKKSSELIDKVGFDDGPSS
jgi:ABC-type Fe3+ transport system substrate-binding protein